MTQKHGFGLEVPPWPPARALPAKAPSSSTAELINGQGADLVIHCRRLGRDLVTELSKGSARTPAPGRGRLAESALLEGILEFRFAEAPRIPGDERIVVAEHAG